MWQLQQDRTKIAISMILKITWKYWAILDNIGQYLTIFGNTWQYLAILYNIGQYCLVAFNIYKLLTTSQQNKLQNTNHNATQKTNTTKYNSQ